MNSSPIITRFAPSPTGYLHLGHAYSALLNADAGDRFILRIEDIDQTRCRPAFMVAIFEDLAWLDLKWEEPVLVQSAHLARYEAALNDLRARGLLYRCFKSRKDVEEAMSAQHGGPGQPFTSTLLPADEEQAKLDAGMPFAWRLCMRKAQALVGSLTWREDTPKGIVTHAATPEQFGDVVLGRKDSGTSYNLASVLDDAMQGITHIIRGEELREAASLHVLLYALFGWEAPLYRHHAMLTNDAGERLSKRDGALALREMRAQGLSAADIRKKVGL